MIVEGQVVLFRFPLTDLSEGKLRPALVVRKLPGKFEDWLICMISSQTHQQIEGFDEVITENDGDFEATGLKTESVFRISRVAVVSSSILVGSIGTVSSERLEGIKKRLSEWILNKKK